jgi:hypothetical protein
MRWPLKREHLALGSILFDRVWLSRGLFWVDVKVQKSRKCLLGKTEDRGFIARTHKAAAQDGLHISPCIHFSKINRLHEMLLNGTAGADNLKAPY